MNITVSAYDRPHYLRESLSALSRCIGIGTCRVIVVCDKSDKTDECVALADSFGFETLRLPERAGCNGAIYASLRFGFEFAGDDFHLHVEDDVVLTRDSLLWFGWARDRYRDDRSIFSVSGYQRKPCGAINQCGRRRWFCPWGWGTWSDRWQEMKAGWASDESVSWDVQLGCRVRGLRFEAYPAVSRVQNIGGAGGAHIDSPHWHKLFQEAVGTSDNVAADPVWDFAESHL